jgi:WD40 repeat protein
MYHLICYLVAYTLTTTVYGAEQPQQSPVDFEEAKRFLMFDLLRANRPSEPHICFFHLWDPVRAVKTFADCKYIFVFGYVYNHAKCAATEFSYHHKRYWAALALPPEYYYEGYNIIDYAISDDNSIHVAAIAWNTDEFIRIGSQNKYNGKRFYPFQQLNVSPPFYMQDDYNTYPMRIAPGKNIDSITVNRSGEFCIVKSKDGTIEFFETRTGRVLYRTENVYQIGINSTGETIFALCKESSAPDRDTYQYKIVRKVSQSFGTEASKLSVTESPIIVPESKDMLPSAALDDTGKFFAYCLEENLYLANLLTSKWQQTTVQIPLSPSMKLNLLDSTTIEIDIKGPKKIHFDIAQGKATVLEKAEYPNIEIDGKKLHITYKFMNEILNKTVPIDPLYPDNYTFLVPEFEPQFFKDTIVVALIKGHNQLALWYCDLLENNRALITAIDHATPKQKDALIELYKNKRQKKEYTLSAKEMETLERLFTPVSLWSRFTTFFSKISQKLSPWWH